MHALEINGISNIPESISPPIKVELPAGNPGHSI